jgi:hypothetical protein
MPQDWSKVLRDTFWALVTWVVAWVSLTWVNVQLPEEIKVPIAILAVALYNRLRRHFGSQSVQ